MGAKECHKRKGNLVFSSISFVKQNTDADGGHGSPIKKERKICWNRNHAIRSKLCLYDNPTQGKGAWSRKNGRKKIKPVL